jgi:hypothetical protein
MADVVTLHGNRPPPGEPSQTAIDAARDLLRAAEAGEVRSLTYVYVDPAGNPVTEWSCGSTIEGWALMAGLTLMQMRVALGAKAEERCPPSTPAS